MNTLMASGLALPRSNWRKRSRVLAPNKVYESFYAQLLKLSEPNQRLSARLEELFDLQFQIGRNANGNNDDKEAGGVAILEKESSKEALAESAAKRREWTRKS